MFDPKYKGRKIADLSEEELIHLGYLGEGVPPEVVNMVKLAKDNPEDLSSITCFVAERVLLYYTTPPVQDKAKAADLPAAPVSTTKPTRAVLF